MIRPCFLVVDPEHSGSISSRKLVIETAKFNVITAYSSLEAIATFSKYPAVDGIVLNAGMQDLPCDETVKRLRDVRSDAPIIVIRNTLGPGCTTADYYLETFNPKNLLNLLQKLFPAEAARIEEHEKELEDKS